MSRSRFDAWFLDRFGALPLPRRRFGRFLMRLMRARRRAKQAEDLLHKEQRVRHAYQAARTAWDAVKEVDRG